MTRRQGYGIGAVIAMVGVVLVVWELAEWVFGDVQPRFGHAWFAGSALILAGVLFALWSRSRVGETVATGRPREEELER